MSMNPGLAAMALLSTVVLAACSTAPDCLDHQSYMNAKTFPPLTSPAGLDVPKQDAEMRIPDVASGPVGTYDKAPGNAETPTARCLIMPPMPATDS